MPRCARTVLHRLRSFTHPRRVFFLGFCTLRFVDVCPLYTQTARSCDWRRPRPSIKSGPCALSSKQGKMAPSENLRFRRHSRELSGHTQTHTHRMVPIGRSKFGTPPSAMHFRATSLCWQCAAASLLRALQQVMLGPQLSSSGFPLCCSY